MSNLRLTATDSVHCEWLSSGSGSVRAQALFVVTSLTLHVSDHSSLPDAMQPGTGFAPHHRLIPSAMELISKMQLILFIL